MTFQITQPGVYKQRDGNKAEIIGKASNGDWVGMTYDTIYLPLSWIDNGRWVEDRESGYDIIAEWPPEPKQYRIWVNVYQSDYPEAYYSKETADRNWEGRIACKEITVTEGEGL